MVAGDRAEPVDRFSHDVDPTKLVRSIIPDCTLTNDIFRRESHVNFDFHRPSVMFSNWFLTHSLSINYDSVQFNLSDRFYQTGRRK
ncbi:hypothetical protein D9M68_311180 [compost metagenome]